MSAVAQVVIVADDLTGAADTAVAFARRGLETLIVLDDGPLPAADVLAISTESRHRTEEAARERVAVAARRLTAAIDPTGSIVYKKIDSTLRGHPGAELDAVMTILGFEQALAAPAFPGQGRTTVGGLQLVRGLPLAETHFGMEVGTSRVEERLAAPGRLCVLLDLARLRAGVDAARDLIAAAGPGVVVADAETDTDLTTLVEASRRSGLRLLCGSAGLAAALAASLPAVTKRAADVVPATRVPSLVVAASRHPRTLTQVEVLRLAGVPILVPSPVFFAGAEREAQQLADQAAATLDRRGALVFTSVGLDDLPHDPLLVATRLAEVVLRLTVRSAPGGLILTGGDVASAVCERLGATAIRLRGEVEPGMPWGTLEGGAAPGACLITKAGGFGDDLTLLSALSWLGWQG